MQNQPTKVRLKGFDSRSIKKFEQFFFEECEQNFQLTDLTIDASICIIDIDVCIIQNEISSLRTQNPDQAIIGVSLISRQSQDELLHYLSKPLALNELKASLYRLQRILLESQKTNQQHSLFTPSDNHQREQEKIQSSQERVVKKQRKTRSEHKLTVAIDNANVQQTHVEQEKRISRVNRAAEKLVGNNSDVDLNNPQELMRVVYPAHRRLQRVLENAIVRAKQKCRPLEVTCLNTGFIIDHTENSIFTAVDENSLKQLCIIDVECAESIRRIKPGYNGETLFAMAKIPLGELIQWSIPNFLWCLSLWTSQGKIPAETDINLPVFLSNWPNFTRLIQFPHSLNIAAALINKPMRLDEVARFLQIPQRYVFAFYSAAKSLGLASVSRRRVDHLFDTTSDTIKVANTDVANLILSFLTTQETTSVRKMA